jgi:hypothetical protein
VTARYGTGDAGAVTPFTVEQIASVCHTANTRLQALAGDPSPSVPWDSESEEIRQSAIAGVEAALRGVTPEELHAEWCRNKAAQGWRRGEFKDAQARTHPCLVPYADLPGSERVKDAVFGAIVAAMSGGEHHACGPLLERAQEALAFERERADAAEAKAARYENGITWGTSCTSCAAVLDSAVAETFRREAAEEKLAKIRDLAESWTADDGHGLPTREMLTEADCGRSVLALLGPQPDAGGHEDSGTADGMPEGGAAS